MSREGITLHLTPRGIAISSLIYSGDLVSVYQGEYRDVPAAIKVQHCTNPVFANSLEREFQALLQLSHPNIMKIYDCFWTENEGKKYLVFAMEWCSKDLAKDMVQRKSNDFPWKEDDFWVVIRKLISALAYMQRQGFAHRDIKPANIFLMTNNEVKIGDLGSALQSNSGFSEADYNYAMRTVVGTPAFLSPLLRNGLKLHYGQIPHNVYKSDVFSLGITLLSLANLAVPAWPAQVEITNEVIGRMVEQVQYSNNVKDLLKAMMNVEEESRGDFVKFEEWISPKPVPLPQSIVHEEAKSPVPLPNSLKCLSEGCGKVVTVSSKDANRQVIQLNCEPNKHVFCSLDCFTGWVLSQKNKLGIHCPACKAPISDTILDYGLATRPGTPEPEQPLELKPLDIPVETASTQRNPPPQYPHYEALQVDQINFNFPTTAKRTAQPAVSFWGKCLQFCCPK